MKFLLIATAFLLINQASVAEEEVKREVVNTKAQKVKKIEELENAMEYISDINEVLAIKMSNDEELNAAIQKQINQNNKIKEKVKEKIRVLRK